MPRNTVLMPQITRRPRRCAPLHWRIALIAALRRKSLVGNPQDVASRLYELAQHLDLQEIVINSWTYDPAARRRSYELLAAEFGLSPARD